MIDRFKDSFREEAYELLTSLETSLLQLEDTPDSQSAIDAIFRCMHTIKGSAAMFGFQHISQFSHEVENVLDKVRDATIKVSKELIDLTLLAKDHIRLLLDSGDSETQGMVQAGEELIEKFKILSTKNQIVPKAIELPKPSPPLESEDSSLKTWRIGFAPAPSIMKNGTRPLQLLAELKAMGDCTIHARCRSLPSLEDLEIDICYTEWDIIVSTARTKNEILDVFMFVQDNASLEIQLIDSPELDSTTPMPLGQILVARGLVDPAMVNTAVQTQKKIGTILKENGVEPEEIKVALDEQEHIKRVRQKVQQDANANTIRVQSEKLDVLVDLVGELVTLQARLMQTAQDIQIPELDAISESFERLAGELRENTMAIRMLPIGTAFSRFKRMVRDLSSELGKEVELITQGEETELDKTVLEKLNDPLVHLIRNCLDHGLETPEQRKAVGKSSSGTIRLVAEHAGASVAISIVDDGKGIDIEAVKAKAVERGLIHAGAAISDDEARLLIFRPGFSTAQTVTKLSGRGVGLDVVKKELESLGGTIHVLSKKGLGTTIRLEIPLTLSIIEGLLVVVGDEHYVIPLGIVLECLEFKGINQGSRNDFSTMAYRNEMLPLVFLREFFATDTTPPKIQQVVVVSFQGQKLGIVLDNVIGDHQTVIKNLGRMYNEAEGISGATILGDGSVALILNVGDLLARHNLKPRVVA